MTCVRAVTCECVCVCVCECVRAHANACARGRVRARVCACARASGGESAPCVLLRVGASCSGTSTRARAIMSASSQSVAPPCAISRIASSKRGKKREGAPLTLLTLPLARDYSRWVPLRRSLMCYADALPRVAPRRRGLPWLRCPSEPHRSSPADERLLTTHARMHTPVANARARTRCVCGCCIPHDVRVPARCRCAPLPDNGARARTALLALSFSCNRTSHHKLRGNLLRDFT